MNESVAEVKAMKKMEFTENQVTSLLPILKDCMTDQFHDYLTSLITHSECGIAFQDIIDTVINCKISISKEEYERFVIAGELMNRDPKILLGLKELII